MNELSLLTLTANSINMPSSHSLNELKTYISRLLSLNQQDWTALATLFAESTLSKGQHFACEGRRETKIGFLTKGVIRAYYQSKDGQQYNKAFFEPCEFFGAYTSMVTHCPSYINIQALTDCTFLVADYLQFQQLFNRHPMLERLARLLAELFYVHKEKREIEMVLLDASTRYQDFRKAYPTLESQVPQFHIASYLGITPTQLSRIRAKKQC